MEAVQHNQEVSVRNIGEESITLVLQKEMELERKLEAARAEADRILDEAKKQAQGIRDKGEKVIEKMRAKAKADQQEKQAQAQAQAVESPEKPLTMSGQEQAEEQRLRDNANQNVKKVVELVLQEIIPS